MISPTGMVHMVFIDFKTEIVNKTRKTVSDPSEVSCEIRLEVLRISELINNNTYRLRAVENDEIVK